jgi:hypothetical protein
MVVTFPQNSGYDFANAKVRCTRWLAQTFRDQDGRCE